MKKVNEQFRASILCGVLCLASFALCACGRKTAPEPDVSALSFQLRSVFVERTEGGCLIARGSIGGATRNVASAVLELQPLEESCEGCPFVPQERVRVEGENIWEAPGSGNILSPLLSDFARRRVPLEAFSTECPAGPSAADFSGWPDLR